jgi:hypothetical protein
MGGTQDHHVEQNKLDSGKQMSHVFCHIENLKFQKRHDSRWETIWEEE